MDGKERIVLGSGDLYITEFTGEIPENSVIEVESNLLGRIKGGATLDYKPEFYDAEDDKGVVRKTTITKEEASLKSGVMTWNGKTLEKLCATARVDDSTPGKRVVRIGGSVNFNNKKYVLHFVHKDAEDGDIRVTIVGSNRSGLSLVFAKDKETVIDAEFKAQPHDSEGTLIIYEEEILAQG